MQIKCAWWAVLTYEINSLPPGGDLNEIKINHFQTNSILSKYALGWMWLDPTDDKSILVQATNHYPSQCWLRSMSPYSVTRPHWVNSTPTSITVALKLQTQELLGASWNIPGTYLVSLGKWRQNRCNHIWKYDDCIFWKTVIICQHRE